MDDCVGVETIYPGVALVTLDRPLKRNALSIALLKQLVDAIDRLAADGQTRVAILRGAGAVFSAGLDLTEAANMSLVRESADCVAAALYTLRHSTIISIAAVHGGAYAGGAGLMAACDLAIGTTDVKIGFPEAQRGLLPALICDALRAKVRAGDLAELFLVGNAIDAKRAQQIGLLQRVTPPQSLLEEALTMAKGILAGGPQTIQMTKSLLRRTYTDGEDSQTVNRSVSADAIAEHVCARRSVEATEGLLAFREKRLPQWNVRD